MPSPLAARGSSTAARNRLTNRVRAIPGVVSTETFPYLQLAKQVYGWSLHLEHDAKSAMA